MMARILVFGLFVIGWNLAAGQDLIITNARILDGTGAVLEQGSVVVTDQRIVSVSAGSPQSQDSLLIDARGMTVMPGLIDTHRHLLPSQMVTSDQALDRWLETRLASELGNYLAAGVTTIMSTGDYFPAIMDVRRRIAAGELQGPRLLTAGSNFSAPDGHPGASIFARNPWGRERHTNAVADPAAARARVGELADAGVDAIKVIYDAGEQDVWPRLDEAVLGEIAAEAQRQGLSTLVHVHGVEELLTAVELGASRFVHTPYRGSIGDAQAGRILREASIPISTTAGIRAPVVSAAGVADITAGAGRATFTSQRQAYLNQTLANVRSLWDEVISTRTSSRSSRLWSGNRLSRSWIMSTSAWISLVTRLRNSVTEFPPSIST